MFKDLVKKTNYRTIHAGAEDPKSLSSSSLTDGPDQTPEEDSMSRNEPEGSQHTTKALSVILSDS